MNSPWLLILGANSDIAVATAQRFAKEGYNIYLASRNLEELSKTAADIQIRFNVQTKALSFDARDFKNHKSFYTDLPIKPAGAIIAFGSMHDQIKTQSDFLLTQDTLESNYTGAVSILEIIADDFETRKSGFIVGISSVAGDRGRQSNYIYGSSKAALSAYLAGLRHRLSKTGISVLTVKPGFVRTKMTAHLDLPKMLTAEPAQVAEAIYKGAMRKKSTIYVKSVWRFIMLIIIHVPEFIFIKTKL